MKRFVPVFDFALTSVANRGRLESQTALCALGGYGRGGGSESCSDLDVSLIFDCPMDRDIETINTYLLPFFWISASRLDIPLIAYPMPPRWQPGIPPCLPVMVKAG